MSAAAFSALILHRCVIAVALGTMILAPHRGTAVIEAFQIQMQPSLLRMQYSRREVAAAHAQGEASTAVHHRTCSDSAKAAPTRIRGFSPSTSTQLFTSFQSSGEGVDPSPGDDSNETTRKILLQLASQFKGFKEDQDMLSKKVDGISYNQDMLSKKVDDISHNQDMLSKSQDMLSKKVDDISTKVEGVTAKLDTLNKKVDRIDKRVGNLVEDKVRSVAGQKLGEDYCTSMTFKAIDDIVNFISNDPEWKLHHGSAVSNITTYLEPLMKSFVKSAVRVLSASLRQVPFPQNDVELGKRLNAIEKELQGGHWKVPSGAHDTGEVAALQESNLEDIVGRLIGIVSKTSVDPKGRFSSKLSRLKRAFQPNGLTAADGPGILLCCALSDCPEGHKKDGNDLKQWIENDCNIFKYKAQLECDLQGYVKCRGDRAAISCGEIKSSASASKEAVAQIDTWIDLIAFALNRIYGEGFFVEIKRSGHVFVFDGFNKVKGHKGVSQMSEKRSYILTYPHR